MLGTSGARKAARCPSDRLRRRNRHSQRPLRTAIARL